MQTQMKTILLSHFHTYPKMQIQDFAKLLYQSEFGGGHMIPNSDYSLKRIQDEYGQMADHAKHNCQLIEPIGNGMCRIYLSALSERISSEVLNQLFVLSANQNQGSIAGLETNIQLFNSMCEGGLLPFSRSDCDAFFQDWKEKGYPLMSHTTIYREAYSPSYRVVYESFTRVMDVITYINEKKPSVIAIDGMAASGKTTLGTLLHMHFPESNLIHMDDFFLQPQQRTETRLSEPGGNIDYERFKTEIISHLSDKKGLYFKKYDCQTQTLGEEQHLPWAPLTIIEGTYSHHPYFGNCHDLKIFCAIPSDVQRKRILKRNGETLWKRFEEEWIPMENRYFETYNIKEKSGLVI